MQFYSEDSSEEERDVIIDETEIWNPNELIDQIKATESEEEKLKLKRELIDKFLTQQRPMLTAKMKDFLVEDGIVEELLNFVSRVPPEKKGELKLAPPTSLKIRTLDADNEEPVRKSFNVMEIFLNPMNDLDRLLSTKLEVILKEMFNTFHPESEGNFHHFNKIMEQLLIRAPVETTQSLVSQNLLWNMLDYIHESPVADSAIDIFCCGFPRQSDMIQFYKSLVDAKMFDRIGERLFAPSQIVSPFMADFFIRLIEKLSSFEMSGVLFISLCRSSAFLDGLFKAVCSEEDTYSLQQKQACASVLRELLLKSGEKVFEQTDFSKPIPNMLSAIHDKLHEHAIVHLEKLCNVVISMDTQKSGPSVPFSSYLVKRPFGMFRFVLVEIVADLIVNSPKSIDKVPANLWRVLSSWFFEYAHNNLFQGQFWKILQVVIRDNHVEALKNVLAKNKFLSRMLEHYKAEQTAARGFIVLIANSLRLQADSQATSEWLRHYLLSHDPWKQFQASLREETERQLKRYSEEGLEEEIEEEIEMDLGSPYARSLGFDKEPVSLLAESPNARKKKRKKQNKRKKQPAKPTDGSAATPESSEGEDKEEGEEEGENSNSLEAIKKKAEEEDKPSAETPSWWLEMTGEFAKEETPPENDWWKDLKDELQKTP